MKKFEWKEKEQLLEQMLGNAVEENVPLQESAVELLAQMRSGKITAESLILASLQQMLKWEKIVNAMISIAPDALQQARDCDDKRNRGVELPLLGLPIVIKDNINVAGLPTTFGARALCDTYPRKDAALVQRLREAGAVIMGKSSLSEFASSGMTANSLIGQTCNPYDLTRTPGGSSGGSAVAVAMGYAAIGIGTDGVNSVRSPASACSLIGHRPSKGSIDRAGIGISSTHQDMPGSIVRTAEDAALVYSVLRGKACTLSLSPNLKGCRIALLKNNCGQNTQVISVVHETCKHLQQIGAELVEIDSEILDAERMLRENNVIRFEPKDNTEKYFLNPENGCKIHSFQEYLIFETIQPEVRDTLESEQTPMWSPENPEYFYRLQRTERNRADVDEWMKSEKIDAVLYPMQRIPVVKIGALGGQAGRNGIMASSLGFPAVCFPAGYTAPEISAPLGIPIGMELMGRPGADVLILSIAEKFEKAFRVRRAPTMLSEST